MDPSTLNQLLNYGVLGVIAIVFFKDYFEKQKRDTQTEERRIEREALGENKRLEHERALAVILNESTTAVTENQRVIKDTKRMHEDLDITIDRIESKIDELSDTISRNEGQHLEVLSTLLWIKETLRGLGEEEDI